jgi:hypothetical protein
LRQTVLQAWLHDRVVCVVISLRYVLMRSVLQVAFAGTLVWLHVHITSICQWCLRQHRRHDGASMTDETWSPGDVETQGYGNESEVLVKGPALALSGDLARHAD